MGCASSKEKLCQKCRNCPHNPVRRSYSLDVHHPPQKRGDSYHIVALTSSTLGSLRLDPLINSSILEDEDKDQTRAVSPNKPLNENGEIDEENPDKDAFAMQMIEAKTWSEMINEKIPKTTLKTPVRTPPGEHETINTWEMMEGLEDVSPVWSSPHIRSFSFHIPRHDYLLSLDDQPTPRVKGDVDSSPKSVPSDSADCDADSNPNDAIKGCRLETDEEEDTDSHNISRQAKDKLIVYFTSLRSVRKTYEDCCHVRVILKGLGVKVDERDVSMHSGFRDELKQLLGEGFSASFLPRVIIGSKCSYGADEIRRLNEEGKLEKMVECCETIDRCGADENVCDACGDVRFVPCETCSGSCKIYCENDYEEGGGGEEFDESYEEFGFQRCPDCNENGLIRCSVCCD